MLDAMSPASTRILSFEPLMYHTYPAALPVAAISTRYVNIPWPGASAVHRGIGIML